MGNNTSGKALLPFLSDCIFPPHHQLNAIVIICLFVSPPRAVSTSKCHQQLASHLREGKVNKGNRRTGGEQGCSQRRLPEFVRTGGVKATSLNAPCKGPVLSLSLWSCFSLSVDSFHSFNLNLPTVFMPSMCSEMVSELITTKQIKTKTTLFLLLCYFLSKSIW